MNKLITTILTICLLLVPAYGQNKAKSGSKKESKGKTIHLTKKDFLEKVMDYEKNPKEWKYQGDKPAIIDFYASWCGPCRIVAPILEDLASEYKEEIYIYKINTEQEQELAAVFGINSLPSLLFIPMEGKPQMSMGALPKNKIKEAIKDVLLENNEKK